MTGLARSRHAGGIALSILAGLFLASVGAFGTGEAPIAARLIYWIGVMVAGALGGALVSELVDRGGWFDDRPAVQGVLIAVGLTLPLTVLIWVATHLLSGDDSPMRLSRIRFYVGPVFIVTSAMTALNYFVQRAPPETHAGVGDTAPARFLERLPARLRDGELHAVEAEDHYLRLHTSKGQDLILMRLADAVAELEGLEGAQVHRSWWVARDAVAEARRGDGRAVLTLKDGSRVPVSRGYAKALRLAGWF
ncbi:MAG: LytTR family DNA-binding domain-containing protein [Caulobacter sp.]|nr:LytTR family DNA-binding domain-containing protein [Caulobacter sp.]